MVTPRIARILIEAMIKHLPPSAASLQLLDVGGSVSETFLKNRPDLSIKNASLQPDSWDVPAGSCDAVAAFDHDLTPDLLSAALTALRPGGRLIVMATHGAPTPDKVEILDAAGYARILVETGAECPLPVGVLMRGERPHITADTLERVQVAAAQDQDSLTLENFNGRFLYLLVRQTPNKPAWTIRADEPVEWHALALDGALVAFSSLPKAVAFMQPAVLAGQVDGINKVGRFSKQVALKWQASIRLNPLIGALAAGNMSAIQVDPDTAEQLEE
jgi:hypothetical protein